MVMSNQWRGIDPDDLPGYLVDYVAGWLKDHDIDSIDRFNESFQIDSFQEDVEEFATEVVTAVLESQPHDS